MGNELVSASWSGQDGTTAPDLEPAGASAGFASSAPELVDRLLHGGRPLGLSIVAGALIILWFGFLSWMFLQDNDLGKLDSLMGLRVFGLKAAAYTAVAVVAGLAILAVMFLHNHLRR